MSTSPRLQSWLEVRGIRTSTDPEFVKLVPWMRTTFVLCGGLIAAGTAFASTPLLGAMVPIAAAGAIFRVHPFDLIYNYGLRHLTGTRPLPPNGTPTRFACGIASVWLVAIALSFALGAPVLAYALGGLFVSVVVIVSVTHFCIPSFLYQLALGDPELAYRAIGRRETATNP